MFFTLEAASGAWGSGAHLPLAASSLLPLWNQWPEQSTEMLSKHSFHLQEGRHHPPYKGKETETQEAVVPVTQLGARSRTWEKLQHIFWMLTMQGRELIVTAVL